jgi:hypothetical protein
MCSRLKPLLVAVALLSAAPLLALDADTANAQTATAAGAAKRADFRGMALSVDVQHIAEWAVHSGDHKGLPFIIVDKVNAQALAFDRTGTLVRKTPVLLGIGVGDVFAPGVVNMNMYDTKPWQRITPAGRFFAEEDLNLKGQRVLWVDYDTSIAIHKLPSKRTKQRRHERIVSPDPAEHRITYGCINVPPAFYDQVVHPLFGRKGGIVYVLPESMPLKSVFRSYDLDGVVRTSNAPQAVRDAAAADVRRF